MCVRAHSVLELQRESEKAHFNFEPVALCAYAVCVYELFLQNDVSIASSVMIPSFRLNDFPRIIPLHSQQTPSYSVAIPISISVFIFISFCDVN